MTETLQVPFNDLKPKVAAHRAAIDRAIARVLDRGYFILGPEVDAFEKELASAMGMKDTVAPWPRRYFFATLAYLPALVIGLALDEALS